jgi:hypothetical protein
MDPFIAITFSIRYFGFGHHWRNCDGGSIFRRQIALDNSRGRTYRTGGIAEFDFNGRVASCMTQFCDGEYNATLWSGLDEIDVAVDGVWLRSGWVFAEEERADGGEDKTEREAAVGVSIKMELAGCHQCDIINNQGSILTTRHTSPSGLSPRTGPPCQARASPASHPQTKWFFC